MPDEAADGPIKAAVIHDAEDVVHPLELRLFDTLIERFDMIQLPVVPLRHPSSPWVSAVYCDEFAEAHGKDLIIREALGAGVPSAGVGCALSRAAMARLAEAGAGGPFDEDSVTEDYEMGLRLAVAGNRAAFITMPAAPGRPAVAVQAYFPGSFATSVRQKTRWVRGIALNGWDRLGWQGGWAERWMRLRDRRAILAALVLTIGYAALALGALCLVLRVPIPSTPLLNLLLRITFGFLLWRVAMRFWMVARINGWRQGLLAIPRMVVGNIIAIAAARQALFGYVRPSGGGMGEDRAPIPDGIAVRLSLPRPPLRAVIAILIGWIGLRAWALWPRDEVPIALQGPKVVQTVPSASSLPTLEYADLRDASPDSTAVSPTPLTKAIVLPTGQATSGRRASDAVAALTPASPERPPSDASSIAAVPSAPTPPAPAATPPPTRSRLTGWAYLFVRPGGGRTLAAGGQLGGSQVAARLAYRLTDRLSVAARAYAPLHAKGAEAAVGADVALAGPVHAIVERRIGVDQAGRDAWSAYLTGGIYRERGAIVADAYAQAGVVGARRRDGFVDGAVRAGVRVGPRGPIVGAGAWGAAQPGAARVDLGPRAAWTEPRTGLTASVEGRFRVAGRARPGSGVALTLARDF